MLADIHANPTMVKKIIQKVVLVIGFAILTLILVPILFRSKFEAFARTEFSKLSGINLDFHKLTVNAFRSFPNLSVTLQEFEASAAEMPQLPALIHIGQLRATLNLKSLFKKAEPLTLTSLQASNGNVWVEIQSDSSSNIDFLLAERPQQEVSRKGKGLRVRLESIEVEAINVDYLDAPGGIKLGLRNLQFRGKGKYGADILSLEALSSIEALNLIHGGIAYFQDTKVSLDGGLDWNIQEERFRFKDGSQFAFNELALGAAGSIAMKDSSIYTDIQLQTAETGIKTILSLIPNAYTDNFSDVSAGGTFALDARILGDYNDTSIPAFRVTASLRDGQFKYPDLPLGITDIAANLLVSQQGNSLDLMELSLLPFQFSLQGKPFEIELGLSRPISDPTIVFGARGQLDLNQLLSAFPFPETDSLSGILTSDIALNGRINDLNSITTSGNIATDRLLYKGGALPLLQVGSARINFEQQDLVLAIEEGKAGRSDFAVTGRLEQLLPWILSDGDLAVKLNANSRHLDLNEWMVSQESGTTDSTVSFSPPAIPNQIKVELNARVGTILLGEDTLVNNQIVAWTDFNNLQLKSLTAVKGSSDLLLRGQLSNLQEYLFKNDTLRGELDFFSRTLLVADFMPLEQIADSTQTPAETASADFSVPAQLRLRIQANIAALTYGEMAFKNVKSLATVGDQQVVLEEFSAETLGGNIRFSGSYSTPTNAPARFQFYYDLQSLDFQQSFARVNTFRMLMPVGKYISGKYTSNLFLEGNINSNFTPDYRSLRGRGFLETSNAVMTDFPALQAIGQQLQIKELQQAVPLGSTKNWFDMERGYVEVPPFDINAGKLSLTIAGRHGIDQQLDYQIQTSVPLKQVQQFTQQIQLPKGVQALQELVSAGQSDWVADLEIGIKGVVNQPKTNILIKGIHSAKEAKTDVGSTSKPEEIIHTVIEQSVDSLREKIGQGIKPELDTLLKQNLPVNRDSLQKSVDQIKKQLEELNPFKKKKKSN